MQRQTEDLFKKSPPPPNKIIVHLTVEVFHIKFQQHLWDYLWDIWESLFMALCKLSFIN
jgi:hypothetical protein